MSVQAKSYHIQLDQELKYLILQALLNLRDCYHLTEYVCSGYRQQLKVTSLPYLAQLHIDQGMNKFLGVLEPQLNQVVKSR